MSDNKIKNMKNGRTRPSLIESAIEIVRKMEERSEDPYKQCAALCLDKDGFVISTGYNGPPSKIEIDWSNRDNRRKWVLHGEENALFNTDIGQTDILVCSMIPCSHCLLIAKRFKVRKIIYIDLYSSNSYGSCEETHNMAKTLGIELIKYEKPREELTF